MINYGDVMRNILNCKALVLTVGLNIQVLRDVGLILKKLETFLSGLVMMSFLIALIEDNVIKEVINNRRINCESKRIIGEKYN